MRITLAQLTRVLIRNRIRLLYKIYLKSHEELHLLRLPRNGYHRQQVHERLPAAAVIDERDLRFSSQVDHVLQIQHRVVVDVLTPDAGRNVAVRGLQEAAITAKDHVLGVAGQALKVVGAVNDGNVVFLGIAHDEGAGKVYRADVDFRIGPGCDTHLRAVQSARAGMSGTAREHTKTPSISKPVEE